MKPLALLAGCAALIAACASTPAPSPARFPALQQAELKAVTASGTHRFTVWIAADDKSREQGLMFVRELSPDHGMLFVFEYPQEVVFWMKDTYLSLDLIFIDPAGTVLNVAANARPLSLDPIQSRGSVIAVLEVLAGTARKIGLTPGNRLILPSLQTTWTEAPKRSEVTPAPRTPN